MVERAGHELFFFFLGKFYHPPPTNVFEVVWGQVEGGMRGSMVMEGDLTWGGEHSL